jgi:hypothetical protein
MRKLIGMATTAVALLGGPFVAWAAPPTHTTVNGILAIHEEHLVESAGGNQTFDAVDHLVFTGGVNGSPVDTYTFTVHPNGSITGQGTETCDDCTIGGRTGSYTERFSFTATPNFATFEGQFTIQDSSGGLSGLRAEGSFVGVGTMETEQLNFHFEPSSS